MVDPNTWYLKKNTLCSLTHKFHIKDRNKSYHFVGHLKLKPADYVEFSKRQEHSAELTVIIASSNISKKKNKASMSSSTSLKNTSHEVSGQIIAVNKPQENEHSSDVMSIDQSFLLSKK